MAVIFDTQKTTSGGVFDSSQYVPASGIFIPRLEKSELSPVDYQHETTDSYIKYTYGTGYTNITNRFENKTGIAWRTRKNIDLLKDFSIVVDFELHSISTASWCGILSAGLQWSYGAGLQLFIEYGVLSFSIGSSITSLTLSTPLVNNRYKCVIVKTGSQLSLYFSSGDYFSITSPITSDIGDYVICARHSNDGTSIADYVGTSQRTVYSIQGYDLALPESEAIALTKAPYQILKPRRKWYYFADAAGIQILINNLSHNNTLDSIALAQANNLTPDNISQSSLLDNIALTQANSIAVNNLDNSNSLDNVTLSQSTQLQANNLSQSNALQSITLTQQNILSIDNSSQSVSIDNFTLNAGGTLTINNISQSNSIDAIALTQAGNLVVNDLSQSNAIDNIALIQANQLQINGLLNNVTIDNIALDFSVILDVNNANQSVSLENIVLTQAGLLAVSDLNQSIITDSIALTQQSTLIVSDLLHDILLDNINLIDGTIELQTNIGTVFVLQAKHNILIKGDMSPIFVIRG